MEPVTLTISTIDKATVVGVPVKVTRTIITRPHRNTHSELRPLPRSNFRICWTAVYRQWPSWLVLPMWVTATALLLFRRSCLSTCWAVVGVEALVDLEDSTWAAWEVVDTAAEVWAGEVEAGDVGDQDGSSRYLFLQFVLLLEAAEKMVGWTW